MPEPEVKDFDHTNKNTLSYFLRVEGEAGGLHEHDSKTHFIPGTSVENEVKIF
jgi:hypothetical protein